MELCFFFSVDVGMLTLVTTDLLSQKAFASPSMGILNIRNLYHNASVFSTHMHNATNSDPNVEDSTVLWAFEYQMIGAQFR
jgi:hypothetical protein